MNNLKIEDAIVVIKPELDKFMIERLIKYIDYTANSKMKISDGILKEDIRNVFGYSLTKNLISDIVYFRHIQNIITNHYHFYKIKFPHISTKRIAQIDLLKYEKGGKYEIHTDHGFTSERTLTVIINLNEDYEGGDFVFYEQNGKNEMKRIKCEKGTMIFFPSNFLYPHRVESITEGTRYSIVSWLI